MSKYHIEAIFMQFPWLKDFITSHVKEKLHNALVQRFIPEFLELEAGYWSEQHGSGYIQVFLFSAAGNHIANAHKKKPWFANFRLYNNRSKLESTLRSLGSKLEEVCYVVKVNDGILTFYKPPKNSSIAEVLRDKDEVHKREHDKAVREIQTQLSDK